MKPRNRLGTGIWLVAAVVAAASLWLFYRDMATERDAQERLMQDRGRTVLNTLTAGLRAQTRMGRYRMERVNAILEELAATPGIVALELKAPGGQVLAAGGDVNRMISVPGEAFVWRGTDCVAAKEAVICGGGPGRGMHAMMMQQEESDTMSLPEGACMLTVVLDGKDALAAIERGRKRTLAGSAATLAALLLGAWAASSQTKRRGLESELATAREQARRQEELTRMGAGLAHETKNPLGIVRGLAQSIEQAAEAPETLKRLASQIVDETDRTVGQINGFLSLARPKTPALERIELDAFLKSFVELVRPEADARRVHLAVESRGARVEADPELLRRALLNLAINALRATPYGGHVSLAYSDGTLSVTDDGCGISPDDLPHVAEPYYGRFEGGSGLGLAIVEQIAQAHGWSLELSSCLGSGTTAFLRGVRSV